MGKTISTAAGHRSTSAGGQPPPVKYYAVLKKDVLGYLPLPILNILVPHVGQVPWVAGRPFFILIWLGLFISFFVRHFMQ
jgi:hypothetical protein